MFNPLPIKLFFQGSAKQKLTAPNRYVSQFLLATAVSKKKPALELLMFLNTFLMTASKNHRCKT